MSGLLHETICAIATPPGEGGVGIVRVSGEKAVDIAAGLVVLRSGVPLGSAAGHVLHHADLLDPTGSHRDTPLDEALVVVMRAPRSYTGEDVVELQCHGGALILHGICDTLVRAGARLAEPGEFTKRAFLNGKLDLASLDLAKDTLKDVRPTEAPGVTVEAIQKTIANHFNIRVSELRSKNNSQTIAFPRQIAMYLCKQMTPCSLPEIGKRFGGKHHSTVIHAIQKIEGKRTKEREFDRLIEHFSTALK